MNPRTPRPATSIRYPIRTVAKLTGLGIDTLRAWERRHNLVRPTRDGRGRMYSAADIERLRLLRDGVANGHGIGRLARLTDAELRTAAAPARAERAAPESAVPSSASSRLMDAVMRLDGEAVDAELGRAASLLGPRALMQDVLVPALTDVGTEWREGRATVAHEHLLAALVRNTLGSLLRGYRRGDAPGRIVLATPAGELHELGTLGAAVLASSGGLGVMYLGPNLPAADLLALSRDYNPDAVVLGVTRTDEPRAAVEETLRTLSARLSPDTELWLGGTAANEFASFAGSRALAIATYDDLVEHLQRLDARF